MNYPRTTRLLAAALLCGGNASSAIELARVEGFGPVARGLAGGGVAHPTGAAAIVLNPAQLLAQPRGHEWMVQLSTIHANIDVRNSQTHENVRNTHLDSNRGPYYLPELAYSYRADNWAMGVGVFGAAGFGIEYGHDSFLSRTSTGQVDTGLEISSRLSALRIPLSLAWQATPSVRAGVAVEVVNLGINLGTLFDAQQVRMLSAQGRSRGGLATTINLLPTLAGAHLHFVEDDPIDSSLSGWGLGGRVGLSWQASPRTSLAIAYEFETHLEDLTGDGRVTAVDLLNNQIAVDGSGRIEDIQLPASVVIGVSHQWSPSLALTGDLRRGFWKDMLGEIAFRFNAEGGLLDGQQLETELPLGFNNLTTLTLGMEWHPRDRWTWRAGASHAFQKTVDADQLNGTFPTLTQNHVVSNVSYLVEKQHEISAGLSYAWTTGIRNPGNNIGSIPAIEGRNHQLIPVLSYRKQL